LCFFGRLVEGATRKVRNLAVIAFAMSDPGSINSIVFGLETKEILPTQNTILGAQEFFSSSANRWAKLQSNN